MPSSCQMQGGAKKRKAAPKKPVRRYRGGSQASDAVVAGLNPEAFRFMSSVLPPAQQSGGDFPRFRLHHRQQEQQQQGGELINRVALLPSFKSESSVVLGGRRRSKKPAKKSTKK